MKLCIRYFLTAIMLTLFLASISHSLDTSKLVGAWAFDEASGNKVLDSSQNKLDGEIKINKGAKRVAGKFGGAIEFSGADMVVIPDAPALDLNSFTIAAWIKVPKLSGKWQIIAAKEARNPTGRNYGIFCNINTGFIHYSFTTAGGWKSFDAKKAVTDGNWHFIAATYQKPDFKLYVDGVLDAEQKPDTVPDVNNSFLYIGGCDIGDYWMTGVIDNVTLFSVGLNEQGIKELMGMDATTAVKPGGKISNTWGKIKSIY